MSRCKYYFPHNRNTNRDLPLQYRTTMSIVCDEEEIAEPETRRYDEGDGSKVREERCGASVWGCVPGYVRCE
jgi:hypothetical protein